MQIHGVKLKRQRWTDWIKNHSSLEKTGDISVLLANTQCVYNAFIPQGATCTAVYKL